MQKLRVQAARKAFGSLLAVDGRISFRAEDVTLEPLNGRADQWAGHIVSAAFLGNQFDYLVQIGSARVHAPGPKHDPLPTGARVRLRLRDGAYAFWSDAGRGTHAE
jgi:hypothetical protein